MYGNKVPIPNPDSMCVRAFFIWVRKKWRFSIQIIIKLTFLCKTCDFCGFKVMANGKGGKLARECSERRVNVFHKPSVNWDAICSLKGKQGNGINFAACNQLRKALFYIYI